MCPKVEINAKSVRWLRADITLFRWAGNAVSRQSQEIHNNNFIFYFPAHSIVVY